MTLQDKLTTGGESAPVIHSSLTHIQTLKGLVKKRNNIKAMPAHPIESDPVFEEYIGTRGAPTPTRNGLIVILRHIAPCKLSELTHQAITAALDLMTTNNYALSSIDRHKRILHAFLTYCLESGHIRTNPASRAREIDKRTFRRWNAVRVDDTVREALDVYYQDPEKATIGEMFLWAAIKSGHRISEAAMATAGDIELRPQPGGGFKPYVTLCTKTVSRTVAFPQWVTPALMALLEAAQGNPSYPLIHLGGVPVVRQPVRKSTLITRSTRARQLFYTVQQKLFGAPKANPHAFRSDYIDRVLRRYPDAATLEKLAAHGGHSPEVLREYYADMLGIGPACIEEI